MDCVRVESEIECSIARVRLNCMPTSPLLSRNRPTISSKHVNTRRAQDSDAFRSTGRRAVVRLRLLTLAAIRQAVAFVALLGVCITPMESLIPDIHDGDALVATEAGGGITDLSSSHTPRSGDGSLPSGQSHLVHMDHCSHAHCFGLGLVHGNDFGDGLELPPIDNVRSAPASVSIPPHHRPPIA